MTAAPPVPIEYQLIGLTEDGNAGDLLLGLDQKQGRIRLQALIFEWLRMENLVILTGSGTSVSAGGKTMANLETAVFATIEALLDVPASIGPIIKARQDAVSLADFLDEPTLGSRPGCPLSLTPLSLDSRRTRHSPVSPGRTRQHRAWTISSGSLIVCVCRFSPNARCPCPIRTKRSRQADRSAACVSLKLVARDSNLGRTHLFTLNYDTLFEQALELLGIQYFDGLTGRAAARFDPSVYGLDIYYPGEVAEGRVRRFDKFLHFYKLHGSIHWFEQDGEMRARHPDLAPFRTYAGLKADEKAAALIDLAGGTPSVGILPTANKFAQTLTMPYAHLFRSFQVRLGIPQTFLLVLGYGFGDDHVSRIIENALMNPSLVMLVIEANPASPVIERVRRYKDLGKRAFVLCPTDAAFAAAKFKHATFDDFARSAMPDVQWLDDFLRLGRFEKQIAASTTPTEPDPAV